MCFLVCVAQRGVCVLYAEAFRKTSIASRPCGTEALSGDRFAWDIAFAGILADKAFFGGHHRSRFWVGDLVAIGGLETDAVAMRIGLVFIAHTSPCVADIPAWDRSVVGPRSWGLIALLIFRAFG